MIGLTKQEKTMLLFLLLAALLGGGVLFLKHKWPHFAPDLVVSGERNETSQAP
jgi:hypothetical protein